MQLPQKNFWRRVGALIVDGLLLYGVIIIISHFFPFFKEKDIGMNIITINYFLSPFNLLGLFLGITYDTLLVKHYQGTLGKILTRIKITTTTNMALGWGSSAARSFTHYGHITASMFAIAFLAQKTGLLDFMSQTDPMELALQYPLLLLGVLALYFILLGLIFVGDWICLFNPKQQALQDLICKTYVVRR